MKHPRYDDPVKDAKTCEFYCTNHNGFGLDANKKSNCYKKVNSSIISMEYRLARLIGSGMQIE